MHSLDTWLVEAAENSMTQTSEFKEGQNQKSGEGCASPRVYRGGLPQALQQFDLPRIAKRTNILVTGVGSNQNSIFCMPNVDQ